MFLPSIREAHLVWGALAFQTLSACFPRSPPRWAPRRELGRGRGWGAQGGCGQLRGGLLGAGGCRPRHEWREEDTAPWSPRCHFVPPPLRGCPSCDTAPRRPSHGRPGAAPRGSPSPLGAAWCLVAARGETKEGKKCLNLKCWKIQPFIYYIFVTT